METSGQLRRLVGEYQVTGAKTGSNVVSPKFMSHGTSVTSFGNITMYSHQLK